MSKIGLGIFFFFFMVATNLHINLLRGMPAGQTVSSFRRIMGAYITREGTHSSLPV